MDSAKDEIESGRKNKDYQAVFVSKDLENSPNVMRVRDRQIAEMDLLKSHYMKLLRHQESSYRDLIRKTYRTAAEYRRFLSQLAKAEEALNEAVLRAYHPGKEARDVTKRMQKAALAVREEEISAFF